VETRPPSIAGSKWQELPRPAVPGGPRSPNNPHGAIVRPEAAKEIANRIHGAIAAQPDWAKANLVNVKRHQEHALAIRNEMHHHFVEGRWFTPNWWSRHPLARPPWHYRYFGRPAAYWWRPLTWVAFTRWFPGSWGQPFYYDYGNNVVYRDNYVYVNGVQVAPAYVYAEQALELAAVQAPPPDEQIDWMPLGTFALTSTQDASDGDLVLQLAVSKEGLVSGTCYNPTTDRAAPVEGRVDPTTQRLAIRFTDQPDVVLETGIYNLSQPQTPVLIHFGTEQTQTWFLVRLETGVEE
jgi:hypothetical protein